MAWGLPRMLTNILLLISIIYRFLSSNAVLAILCHFKSFKPFNVILATWNGNNMLYRQKANPDMDLLITRWLVFVSQVH